jgi:hypothetical protein
MSRAKRVRADYPSKQTLTETEVIRVLRDGPDPKWFQPWADQVILFPGLTKHSWGYIHVYSSNGSFQYDFAVWADKEGLSWGLEDLHGRHTTRSRKSSYPRCDDCLGILYFVPDEPLRMYLVIEVDEEEGDQ